MKKISQITLKVLCVLLLSASSLFAVDGVLTVTNTNDSGAGSLRQAITDANSDPFVPHVIIFSIGSGVQTIQPTSALPAITASYTFIDGTTQPGWSSNPIIILSGASLTPYSQDGLVISGAHHCLIRGLVINNGFNNGVLITDNGIGSHHNTITQCFIGTNQTGTAASGNYNGIAINGAVDFPSDINTIGGFDVSTRNLISGNAHHGITLSTNVNNNQIFNNYIGTDASGTAAIANGADGVVVLGSSTPIIEEQAFNNFIAQNVISGNTGNGIKIQKNSLNTFLQGNLIGVDYSGTSSVANEIGILLQGDIPADPEDPTNGSVRDSLLNQNVVAGNRSHGIMLDTNVLTTQFSLNSVGVSADGLVSLGNGGNGIYIQGNTDAPCTGNAIGGNDGGNMISYNGTGTATHYGILIDGDPTTPSVNNGITKNNIFGNKSNGIKLLNNSNNAQEAPTLINALINADGGAIIISATAPSTPASTNFQLDFFMSDTDRSPITEGKTYLGSIGPVKSGDTVVKYIPLSTPLASNVWVSATAGLFNGIGRPGDTSEFTSNLETEFLPNNIPAYIFRLD